MKRRIDAPRRSAAHIVLATAMLIAGGGGAEAHRLKMFVTVEAGEISGYAFFIGGGRPEGVDVVVKDAAGAEVHRGKTDDQGNFRWRPTVATDLTVTVDSGDGHWVESRIAADRLGSPGVVAPAAVPRSAAATSADMTAPAPSPSATAAACPTAIDPAEIAGLVEARVDRAVARQLRPLIEAQTQAEGRVRFNDVMGGVGMIVGLAGAGLWATSRRRREGEVG